MEIGYHASHEQFPPSELLHCAELAEQAGFEAVLSSDHLSPWSEQQGQSGFAHSWLGAAMVRTRVPYGVVTAPGDRYHPVVVAQAIATLAELAPGRFLPALGSGQALNEHVTGRPWPDKATRNQRLAECAMVIRRLLHGETVDHDGLVTVREARLFTLPPTPPQLLGAALTPRSAAAVGEWADGLITVGAPLARMREVIDAFGEAAGSTPLVHVQLHVAWAETDEEAEQQAVRNWRANALPPEKTENLASPREFDEATSSTTAADLRDSVLMSAEPGRHGERLQELSDLGVARVYVHHVGRDQQRFIETYADDVLPRLR